MQSHGRRTLTCVSRLALAAALLFAACETRRTVMAPEQSTVQPQFSTAPTELFFSEYIEGSSNNKALEIYNGTGSAINLGTGGYKVEMFFNGGSAPGLTIILSGTVAAGDVFVLAHSAADPAILAQADQTNGAGWFNGDDAVALVKGTTKIDVIGQIGLDPGAEWGTGLASTADNTLIRYGVCAGDPNGTDAFDPAAEWLGYATNTFNNLGVHGCDPAPSVIGSSPLPETYSVAPSANLEVTFSEAVNVAGGAFAVTCSASGAHAVDVSGGPTVFVLDPVADFGAEMCTVTVSAAGVSDQDAVDPWDTMMGDYSFSFYTTGYVDAAPAVASTAPADGAVLVPLGSNISVTFSEPVNVAEGAFGVSCGSSGTVGFALSGGPTTYTLDPATDLPVEGCTVTVTAAQVSDQDPSDPPDNMAADYSFTFYTVGYAVCALPYTSIPAIQGSGPSAALTGIRSTKGIVVGDFEGPSPALRGFFIQDEAGDGDPATSDAIFVFNGSDNDVSLGDLVRVTGTVAEYQGQTQFGSVTEITSCGTGSITPTDVSFPVTAAGDLERYEGMLVRLPQTMYVTEHYQLGRFGEVLLSSGARLFQPTSVASPGAAALAVHADNLLNQIILDDAVQTQNPDPILFGRGGSPLSASNTLRGGDVATGIIGVMTYTWGGNEDSPNAYRVRPINALGGYVNFEPANARPTSAPEVGGTLRVAGMNLLNYYNTFSSNGAALNCTNGVGGAASLCRGASSAAEFERQVAKLVSAIVTLAPDVLGVLELENDGYGPSSAIADLVGRLNDASAPGTFAFVDADAATGQVNALGTDGIKVGLIYRTAAVMPVGTTAVLNSEAFVNGGDTDPNNRPSLAQAFEQPNHARVVVVVNHLRSKGGACDVPDAGDGQGECNAVRTNAVLELKSWLATDPTGTLVQDVLLLGDFNAYAKEDPIANLVAGQAYSNLIDYYLGAGAYSYVFDGQWAYMDYAFASSALRAQVTGTAIWHINADEPGVLDYNTNFKSPGQITSLYAVDPFRTSDHDPVLVGLSLGTMEFGGLLSPLSLSSYNTVTAGSSIPVRFSLNGYHGTTIFAAGYPEVKSMACPDPPTLGVAPMGGGSGKAPPQLLTYDPETGTYAYLWRTEKGWANSCRQLTLRFTNGSEYAVSFRFTR